MARLKWNAVTLWHVNSLQYSTIKNENINWLYKHSHQHEHGQVFSDVEVKYDLLTLVRQKRKQWHSMQAHDQEDMAKVEMICSYLKHNTNSYFIKLKQNVYVGLPLLFCQLDMGATQLLTDIA